MLLVFVMALFFIFFGLYASLLIYKTVKCPFGIFTITWNGLLLLCSFNLVGYEHISGRAIVLMQLSYLLFAIGSLSHGIVLNKSSKAKNEINNRKEVANIESLDFLINVSLAFSLLGGLLWMTQVISIIGFGNIFNFDTSTKTNLSDQINPAISYLIYVSSLGGSILFGLVVSKHKTINKKYLLLFISPALVAFISTQRSFLIIMILSFIAPLLISGYKNVPQYNLKDNKKINRYIILSILILIFTFLTIGRRRGSFDFFIGETNVLSNMILKTYTYLTGAFPAFSKSISNWDGELGFGVNTFTPLSKLTNFIGLTEFNGDLIKSIETGRPPVNIPFNFNIYTFLWDIICDFGYVGLLIFLWVLGFASSYLWSKRKNSNGICKNDVTLSFIMVFLLYSFVSSITNYSVVWYGFGYAYLAIILSKKIRKHHTL